MFDKVSIGRLEKSLLLKYIFQIFVAPLFLSLLGSMVCLIVLSLKNGLYTAIIQMFKFEGELNDLSAIIILMYVINLANVVSIITGCALLIDMIKPKVIEQEMKIKKYSLFMNCKQ